MGISRQLPKDLPEVSQKSPALAARRSLNQCTLETILNAEQILLDLSKKGKPFQKTTAATKQTQYSELQKPYPRDCHPHVMEARVNMSSAKTKASASLVQSELLPLASARSPYTNFSTGTKKHDIPPSSSNASTGSSKAKIIPDSLHITELRTVTGITLDLKVKVYKEDQTTQMIPVCIECPNFQPKRICFNGEWRKIASP